MKAAFLAKLDDYLAQAGLSRVHSDAVEPTARAALAALAGVPHYEQIWAGDLRLSVQVVAIASGERVPGADFARRAQLLRQRAVSLSSRVAGEVQVLQLALYDRPVPPQEREFVLSKARIAAWWPLSRGRVATWIAALSEPALYSGTFRGWPQELSADQLRALLR
ncbi:MAG TPA: hypothetical protein VFE90_15400 [Myxococcales bacterium]|jgi:hypothetical protein|nr:hypothetical protein [Myxococcales bacterium]